MNIRFIGIDGLGGHEVNRIFSKLTDFDFIKSVGIREFNIPKLTDFDCIKAVGIRESNNSCCEVLNIYDVNIEIEPDRDNVSIHIFDNSIYIVDHGCEHRAVIYIDRSAYERVEII